MIGGVEVFFPLAQGKAKICIAYVTTTEGRLSKIVREEELEKISEATQVGAENEHSKECLNSFSQEAKEVVALKLIAKESRRG
jgi:hypothetical protein